MNNYRQHIPITVEVSSRGLGRHINWDPRSKAHRVERSTLNAVSKFYHATNHVALDQLDLGACTGFSLAQCLNSEPFNCKLSNLDARDLYHLATLSDSFDGSWPPKDTGSSGLAVMKAAKKLGHINSYKHCFNLDDVIQGLQEGPGIAGINWYEGFDEPDPTTGLVLPKGRVRGGHEITIQGCDLDKCLVWFRTSYGPAFGVTCHELTGCFCMDFATAQAILFTDGDATFPKK